MIKFADFDVTSSFLELTIEDSSIECYSLKIPYNKIESIIYLYEVNGFGVNLTSGKTYICEEKLRDTSTCDRFLLPLEDILTKATI